MCVVILLLGWESVQSHAQQRGNAAKQLVGAWRLVSWQERLADGATQPSPVTGAKGIGSLMYTDTGRMCAVLMNPGRPSWKAQVRPQDAEVRAAYDGFVAYCGTYEINEDQRYVVHHVEMDKTPNVVGTDRKRFFTFQGNRLVLQLPPPLRQGVVESTLVWERVQK